MAVFFIEDIEGFFLKSDMKYFIGILFKKMGRAYFLER
jgi:hypothetical protein